MKPGKIILSAMFVFTIIGGTLAFKAQKTSDRIYTKDLAGNCVVTVIGATTIPHSSFFTITYATNLYGAPCVLRALYIGL